MAKTCRRPSHGPAWKARVAGSMKIAHISDLHLTVGGEARMGQNLEKLVAHINGLSPDMVLVSGDITHNALLVEAESAAEILAKLTAPYYLTPGNHDRREGLQAAFPAAALPADQQAHLSYVIEGETLRILALDSTDPDAPNGRICQARAAWLEAALGQSAKPALIFMHHPPMKCGVEETDCPPMQGADLLAKVVARHAQIERILCGHVHLPVQALWQGRLVCAAPSLGMRLSWSPNARASSQYFASSPAYLWHMQNADGGFVSHEFTLDDPAGPFDFT